MGKGKRKTDLVIATMQDQHRQLVSTGSCEPWFAREVLDLDPLCSLEGVTRALHRELHKWLKMADNRARNDRLLVIVGAAQVVLRERMK